MQSPKVPPIVTEIAVGGLWLASSVVVAGYTWEAVTKTWSQLPNPGGRGTTATIPPGVVKADKAIGVPNLPRNKDFPMSVSGVAASPPPLAQNLPQKAANALVNAGKWIINLVP